MDWIRDCQKLSITTTIPASAATSATTSPTTTPTTSPATSRKISLIKKPTSSAATNKVEKSVHRMKMTEVITADEQQDVIRSVSQPIWDFDTMRKSPYYSDGFLDQRYLPLPPREEITDPYKLDVYPTLLLIGVAKRNLSLLPRLNYHPRPEHKKWDPSNFNILEQLHLIYVLDCYKAGLRRWQQGYKF